MAACNCIDLFSLFVASHLVEYFEKSRIPIFFLIFILFF
uniref:Uncharacterized protein n=1 Tax=Zea mays TaxID=4577 RepID=B4FVY6_MAIZE|nr:unknown [Zea mays]